MSKKLLNKTLRVNLIFSVLVLLIAAPLFYFATEKLYLEETDETLHLKKNEFVNGFQAHFKAIDIPLWNRINRDVKIKANFLALTKDTIFFHTYFDSIAMEDEYCRVLASPVKIEGEDFVLEAKVSLVETEDLLENIVALLLGVLLILLLGFYLITRMFSKNLWQPFYDTLEKIEQFEIDKDLQPAFGITRVEEFNRLNQAITKLSVKNIAIFKSQREFIENAAHELQTPLAVFTAKIDTLIQRSDITEQQAEILMQLNDAAARLNKLNKNLLLLSKIESRQFSANETISLNEVLSRQLVFFQEQSESKHIVLDVQVNEEIILKSNQILVEVLISNLFLNAIKHNVQDGVIHISLGGNSLRFSNSGNQQPLDSDKLFQRFAKVNPSSSGNGLGLSIIKKITMLNGWMVVYKFENNLHIFEIIF